MAQSIQNILQNTFGYSNFRHQQADIIEHVVGGQDAVVIMPTGGGKSLCYQIPALHLDGLTVVVSPLIALMDDQVAALQQLDVAAAALHSNSDDTAMTFDRIRAGQLDLLYVSPERLLSDHFLDFIESHPIALFAIDEAHCVSVWGNDFRPEYVRLSLIKQRFPDVPVLALTATADHATQADITRQLGLHDARMFLSSFERTNITTQARPGQKRLEQMVQFINEQAGRPGIVYCLSRKSTEKVAADLRKQGIDALPYHAAMTAADRRQVQAAFQNDSLQVVCATIAFGMGIDKPNIAWVIHYNLPKNIEGYYQEIGRAGRDGEPAEALLFYSWGDYLQLQRFIVDSSAPEQFTQVQQAKLERMWQFATAMNCRTSLVLNYFGEYRAGRCDHCDNCVAPPTIIDGTIITQKALSAVVRAKQQVGIQTVIGILRGATNADIRQHRYDQIQTYGAGRDIPFPHWQHYITQLINLGLLRIDFTDGSRLKLTPLSQSVLRGGVRVELAEYIPEAQRTQPVKKAATNDANIDEALLERLRAWRKQLAKQQRVPAFVIFSDKTLRHLSSAKPKTLAELLTIDGIGPVKQEKYGQALLEIIVIIPGNDNKADVYS